MYWIEALTPTVAPSSPPPRYSERDQTQAPTYIEELDLKDEKAIGLGISIATQPPPPPDVREISCDAVSPAERPSYDGMASPTLSEEDMWVTHYESKGLDSPAPSARSSLGSQAQILGAAIAEKLAGWRAKAGQANEAMEESMERASPVMFY